MASKSKQYEKRTEELLTPIARELGFEVVDVEYVKEGEDFVLRAFIQKDGGITLNDCEAASKRLEEELDRENLIDEAYILEVSSPGDRPFKKDRDFERNIGNDVEIKTYKEIGGEKQFFGILKEFDENSVTVTCDDEKDLTIDKKDIAFVRLSFRF